MRTVCHDGLDLDGMERVNAKFHAETTGRRDGDMIWRMPRHGGGDTYLVRIVESNLGINGAPPAV